MYSWAWRQRVNALADFVKSRIAELNIANKEVALRFQEACPEKMKPGTATTKLSKLVNGEDEGVRFVEPTERLRALATALEVPLATLADLLRVAKEVVHLVLDVRLSPEVATFLRAQQAAAAYRVVDHQAQDRVGLRDEARQHSIAWVVVADGRDAEFLDGAGVNWTPVASVPRGWRLEKLPDLVPVPPPRPPRLFGTAGVPMVPCEALVARLSIKETYHLEDLRKRVQAMKEVSEVPTFTLEELVRAEKAYGDLFGWQRTHLTAAGEQLTDELAESGAYLWTMPADEPGRQGKVFGDLRHRMAKLFAEHHELHPARAVDELRRVKTGSPFSALARSPDSLVFDGVSISAAVGRWARPAIIAMNPDVEELNRKSVEIRQELEPQARQTWMAIRKRNIVVPRRSAWIGHMLAACDEAPVVVLQADKDVLLDAVFSLGAGRTLSVVARQLTDEPKATLNLYDAESQDLRWSPVRPGDSSPLHFQLDGGDVHLWFWAGYAEPLEGTAIPARTRRWEREAAAAQQAFDMAD